jgi:hypothetical protein
MWRKILGPARPQMTIQHGACTWHAGLLELQTPTRNINDTLYLEYSASLVATWHSFPKSPDTLTDPTNAYRGPFSRASAAETRILSLTFT